MNVESAASSIFWTVGSEPANERRSCSTSPDCVHDCGHRREHAVEVLAHPVRNDIPAHAEPVVPRHRQLQVREPVGRDKRAPHQDIGELLLLGSPQGRPNRRVNAIRADHRVATNHLAVFQGDVGALRVLGNRRAFCPQPDHIGRHGVREQVDQVRAVDVVEQRAVTCLCLLAQRSNVQKTSRGQLEVIKARGHGRNARQRRLEPQFPQHDRAVRSDLDARSDLGQLRGALQYNRLDAVAQQRQSGREATNASSNDYDFHAKFLQLG
jgi:hypothetical protein